MMSRRTVVLMVGLLLLATCDGSSKDSASSVPTSAPTRSSAQSRRGSTLQVVMNKKLRGPVIANTWKRTVYVYVPDGSAKTSKVPAALKKSWPRVVAIGKPSAGPYLSRSKLAVFRQPNGQLQVSYNGHLLYTFVGDRRPGVANGQGLGKVWYALRAGGDVAR